MGSIFTGEGDTPAFRTSWRGYDRAEVDAFLRRTAADRQRLQEDLAQLEAFMATSGRNEWQSLAVIARCLFYKQTTHREYETRSRP